MDFGRLFRRIHSNIRNGTTSLFAVLDSLARRDPQVLQRPPGSRVPRLSQTYRRRDAGRTRRTI